MTLKLTEMRPEFRRKTRIGDYPAPEVDGLSAYHRQRLPWRFFPSHYWENGLIYVSGDGMYEAVLHMYKDNVEARVTRLYSDREGKGVFWAAGDCVPGLEPNALKARLTLLFEQCTRERLAEIGHLHWGAHNEFCTKDCTYVVLPVDQDAADRAADEAFTRKVRRRR